MHKTKHNAPSDEFNELHRNQTDGSHDMALGGEHFASGPAQEAQQPVIEALAGNINCKLAQQFFNCIKHACRYEAEYSWPEVEQGREYITARPQDILGHFMIHYTHSQAFETNQRLSDACEK